MFVGLDTTTRLKKKRQLFFVSIISKVLCAIFVRETAVQQTRSRFLRNAHCPRRFFFCVSQAEVKESDEGRRLIKLLRADSVWTIVSRLELRVEYINSKLITRVEVWALGKRVVRQVATFPMSYAYCARRKTNLTRKYHYAEKWISKLFYIVNILKTTTY